MPDVPLGDYQVQAACIDPATHTTTRTYVPARFKVTSGPLRFRTSASSILPGTTITATPDNPCPADYLPEPRFLLVSGTTGMGRMLRPLEFPVMAADGQWKTLQIYIQADKPVGTDSLRFTCVGGGVDDPVFVAYQSVALTIKKPTATRYVALGDSYSAGEGVPPFSAGTNTRDNTCHRSPKAYPQLVSCHGLPDATSLRFRACAGATVAAMVSSFKSEPRQLLWIDASARYVTLSIGGNDVCFAEGLAECVYGPGAGGSPGCRSRNDKRVRNRIKALGSDRCPSLESCSPIIPSLQHLFERIQRQAPQANIRVITYPHLFPENPGAQVPVWHQIAGKTFWYVNGKDAHWINQMGDLLNGMIGQAVVEASQKAVTIDHVSAQNGLDWSFSGHAVGDPDPWIRGAVPTKRQYSFHPNAAGQCALAARTLRDGFDVSAIGVC